MKKILPENINDNIFKLIGKDWMLVAAQKDGKVNAMTASWGFGGVMWGKNAVVVGIRPQRYTKEFVDNGDTFSITILPESYRETMSYFGTVSGRDEDKIAKTGLTVAHDENTPYFEEGRLVLICKKMYSQEIGRVLGKLSKIYLAVYGKGLKTYLSSRSIGLSMGLTHSSKP